LKANNQQLTRIIAHIVSSTPVELLHTVLLKLFEWDNSNWNLSRANLLASILNPKVRANFQLLVDTWHRECPTLPGETIAIAMQSCMELQQPIIGRQVDLVWTGPETTAIPLRRTEQTLLQLIHSAQRSLLIVSFAVYKIDSISEAIQNALTRHVKVTIVLESSEESNGKITFPGQRALGNLVLEQSSLYVWPLEKRLNSDDGRSGSLHAKIALADEDYLFITSANLTEYAMTLNMEMGVLIQGSDLPRRVGKHFEELISQTVLVQVNHRSESR